MDLEGKGESEFCIPNGLAGKKRKEVKKCKLIV
jgi:hypothetical protein